MKIRRKERQKCTQFIVFSFAFNQTKQSNSGSLTSLSLAHSLSVCRCSCTFHNNIAYRTQPTPNTFNEEQEEKKMVYLFGVCLSINIFFYPLCHFNSCHRFDTLERIMYLPLWRIDKARNCCVLTVCAVTICLFYIYLFMLYFYFFFVLFGKTAAQSADTRMME